MVRVISQETFDAVVRENVEELGMDRKEATKDAVEQFKAQGVDLSNVVMPEGEGEGHAVLKALDKVATFLKEADSADWEVAAAACDEAARELARGLPERVLATQNKGYETLVSCAGLQGGNPELRLAATRALCALLDGNPDPLEGEGFKVLLAGLSDDDERLVSASLELALNCCVRHEQNRQNLVRNGLLDHLDRVPPREATRVSRVWQALVQDDDVRVPFGSAHDHARAIVEEHDALGKLIRAIKENAASKKEEDLTQFLSSLSSLTVRNEYCQTVAIEEEGLKSLLSLLLNPDQSKAVVRESLRLIKTLAGNDNVKKEIQSSGGISVVINSVTKNMASKPICFYGCGALTAVCLRNTENARQVAKDGGAQLLTQILKTHMDSSKVLTACCNAIRNVVSRSSDLRGDFVNQDVESLLQGVRSRHPGECDDAAKAALRDLGLKVELKEEWTGGLVKQ